MKKLLKTLSVIVILAVLFCGAGALADGTDYDYYEDGYFQYAFVPNPDGTADLVGFRISRAAFAAGSVWNPTISVPDSMNGYVTRRICEGAFQNPYGIGRMDLRLPDTVTEIEDGAFSDWASLRKVFVPAGVSKIGDSAFAGVGSDDLEIVVQEGSYVETYCKERNIRYAVKRAEDDYRYEVLEDGTAAVGRYNGSDREITIPAEMDGHRVTTIGVMNYAGFRASYFYLNDHVETVIVPDTVTSIPGSFSQGKNLKTIVLPDSVTDIPREICSKSVEFIVGRGSYAEQYCREHGYQYVCRASDEQGAACGVLDVTGRPDGDSSADNVKCSGTFDVYIDGKLVMDDVSACHEQVPAGSRYEIRDIRPATGYVFQGAAEGAITGTVPENQTVSVRLMFAGPYDVRYDQNTADPVSGMPGPQQKEHGTALVLLPNTPKRTGYTFLGWAVSADGPAVYQPGDSYAPDASMTLYAVWEPESAVSCGMLDVNGWLDGNSSADDVNGYGTFDVYIDGKLVKNDVSGCHEQVPAGSRYEIKNISALSGHAFKGVAEGSLTGTVQADQTVRVRLKFVSVYRIGYNQNTSDSVSNVPPDQVKEYGEDLTLISYRPDRRGYTFLGWATSKDGPVVYQRGDTYTLNASVTLYAVWKKD